MTDQTQAYAGQGDRSSGTSEWNRLESAIRSVLNRMATMTLVKVVAVGERSVDIKPMVAQLDGAGNAVEHGVIHNVPVWRYQTAGAAVIVTPAVGDVGMAVFAHSDISTAKATSDDSPPGSKRRFDWSDAVYLGGFFGDDEPATRITLSAAGGVVVDSPLPVQINAPVQITGGLTVDGSTYATHKHTGVQTGGGVSGPVTP